MKATKDGEVENIDGDSDTTYSSSRESSRGFWGTKTANSHFQRRRGLWMDNQNGTVFQVKHARRGGQARCGGDSVRGSSPQLVPMVGGVKLRDKLGSFQSCFGATISTWGNPKPIWTIIAHQTDDNSDEVLRKIQKRINPFKKEERIMLKGIFLNGLKEEIQAELKLYDSKSLDELMDRALLIEENNQVL